jgi:serine O-acetyltransferase
MMKNLREDTRRLRAIKTKPFPFYVLESLLFENGYQAVVLYRLAHWFKSRRIPVLGPFFARLSLFLTSVDIAPAARIGPGLFISHGIGLVVGDGVRIGGNGTLLHQVTIGAPTGRRLDQMPTLGDSVFVGAGSRLIGEIEIGDDVFIGVNCVVTQDIPAGTKVTTTAGLTLEAGGSVPVPDESE